MSLEGEEPLRSHLSRDLSEVSKYSHVTPASPQTSISTAEWYSHRSRTLQAHHHDCFMEPSKIAEEDDLIPSTSYSPPNRPSNPTDLFRMRR